MEEQFGVQLGMGILVFFYLVTYVGFLYYAGRCGRYKYFVNKHIKKENEFNEWDGKRKEMNEW